MTCRIHSRDVPSYILAGGKSLRFGSDKARVPVQGVPNLQRLMQSLTQFGHRVQVVADREDRYADLDISALADEVHDAGPMAGLATSLKHRQTNLGDGWLLLISCDQVIWKESWFELLVNEIQIGTEVVVFGSDVLQPIPGLYHTSLLATLEKSLIDSHRSIRRLLLQNPEKTRILLSDENPQQAAFNDERELKRLLDEFSLDATMPGYLSTKRS